jgi:hypothetical protein
MKNLQDTGIDNVLFSAVQRQQRKSESWRLLVSPTAAPSIITKVPHQMRRIRGFTHTMTNDDGSELHFYEYKIIWKLHSPNRYFDFEKVFELNK